MLYKSLSTVALVALGLVACQSRKGNDNIVADDSAEIRADAGTASIQAGLDAAVKANEARMAPLRADKAKSHYRDIFGSEPYLKLHPATEAVKGTVVVFHGFSGMPVQQNPFVDYLYAQGYDVFNASVAGHYKVNVPGAEHEFSGLNAPIGKKIHEGGLQTLDNVFVAWPYSDYGRNPVEEYNAEVDETWNIAKTLRKPFFVAGLSAGATQALAMGAKYKDFKRVAAFTPLLDLEPTKKQALGNAAKAITLARGLGQKQWDGWFAWDKTNPFPQGCFWGLQKYGQSLVPNARSYKTSGQQIFFVTTDNEDAADSAVTKSYFDAAGGAAGKNFFFNYAKNQKVPHPVNAIMTRSQNMVNFYYKTLFQETVRFFNEGTIKADRLSKHDFKDSEGSALPGFTPGMDWEVSYFGGAERAYPVHVELNGIK